MRLLSVLGASQALADHLARHPEQWRELDRPVPRLHPPPGVRRPVRPAAGRRRRPRERPSDGDPAAPRGRRRPAGGVPPRPGPARGPRPGPPPRGRRRRRRALRPRRRHPRGRAGDRPGAGGRGRVRTPGGDRARQVRGPRAQLRLRRRRPLRLRAGRGRRRGVGRPGRHPAGLPSHAGLLRAHHRGHDLAGRRQPAPRGQGRAAGAHPGQPSRRTTSAGPRPGSSRRCSRRGRWPATSTWGSSSSTWSRRWCGRWPSATASSPTCRRCAGGCSSTSRPREAERQLKLGSGGLRDVEFAVQLLQLVHGRDRRAAPRPGDAERARRPDPAAATSAARTARRCTAAYAFLRTLEHRIQLQHLRRTHVVPADEASLRRLGRAHGLRQGAGRGARGGLGAPPPRGTPAPREALLPAAARGRRPGARRRGAAHHRGGRAAARGARLRRPEGAPCATSRP